MHTIFKAALLFSIVIHLYSCSNSQNIKPFNFNAGNDSLTILNNKIKMQNDSLDKILKGKLQDERTAQVAVLWYSKAQRLQYETKAINTYIENSISNLKTDSVLNNTDSLYAKLDFYKGDILRIDPDISEAINKNAEIITYYFDSVKQSKSERFDLFLSRKSKEEQLFIFNQTLNNIESVENGILIFCNNKAN
jgi:hypothetical protein